MGSTARKSKDETIPNFETAEDFVRRDSAKRKPLPHKKICKIYRHLKKVPDSPKAKKLIVQHNQGLVMTIASKFMGRSLGLTFADLVQEGNIGLLRASVKYKHELGYAFSTYATFWIRQEISRAIMNKGRVIRVPIQKQQQKVQVDRKYAEAYTEFHFTPNSQQLAKATGLSREDVEQFKTFDYDVQSLEQPISEDGPPLGDTIPDNNHDEPDFEIEKSADRAYIHDVLAKLPRDERRFVNRLFGISTDPTVPPMPPRSDVQLAYVMGITPREVRKRKKLIFEKLRAMIDISQLNCLTP